MKASDSNVICLDENYEKVKNRVEITHASTHFVYTVEVIDTFLREGESERTKALDNCMILWFRSRRSNRAGTWYMFGKVAYFSYVACRSADYCCTSPSSSRGCLLLCKVALGKTHDSLAASTS
ncbi:Poly [ADP-ribose] polymerase [Echinococcus granulosus]|uniref:Poly [ADP-ribose] polymerase n=1 Tax=Echinococcus granulosus TaxID=6210 RepID=W6TZN5_ECHGR|nr:Poly [ADP-ribose] polymerase [Echinococcus granulosus]EUB54208.1 Poly [ADP-ribose] polymerase [Echinococcus granulosus]